MIVLDLSAVLDLKNYGRIILIKPADLLAVY
jgi:hypothetical protein